jgi:hypothetical protein
VTQLLGDVASGEKIALEIVVPAGVAAIVIGSPLRRRTRQQGGG